MSGWNRTANRRLALVASVLLVTALMVTALSTTSFAQRANVPGIIGGVLDGNPLGAAAAAQGYGYWGSQGYLPGSRDRYGRSGLYGSPYGGGYYGSGFYGPTYRGIPGPVVVPQFQYNVAPGRVTVAPRSRATYQAVPANPPLEAEPYHAVILNPEDNDTALRFSVNGEPYELDAGEQEEFSGRQQRVIQFDRGTDAAPARYKLSDALYTFRPSDRGWELYRETWDKVEAQDNGSARSWQLQPPPEPVSDVEPIDQP